MPRGDRILAGMRARIAGSAHELTVHYPPARVPATAPVSGSPLSPLTGPVPTSTIVAGSVTPVKPAVTVNCLWQQAPTATDARPNKDRVSAAGVAWLEGATTMALVLIEDTALDPSDPTGATIFDGADFIEHRGKRYSLMQVDTAGSGFLEPHSYVVWLSGARVQ